MKRLFELLTVAVLLGVAVPARAGLCSFDELPGSLGTIGGYQGFTWSTYFDYLDASGAGYSNSGYRAGMVSSPNVAFNAGYFGGAYDVTVTRASLFEFNGAYFTGAWNDGLNIDISGLRAGVPVYSTTVTVNSTAPTWAGLNWANVDELTFHSSGGTAHGLPYVGTGTQFVMDNFTFSEPVTAVPVPGAVLLGAVGLSFAGWRLKRQTA